MKPLEIKIGIMKKHIIIGILFPLFIFSCEKEAIDHASQTSVKGLSLYWQHEVFGEESRRLEFSFTESRDFDIKYDLIFDYNIQGRKITVTLVDIVNVKPCPLFPSWDGKPTVCQPRGGIYIEDKLLDNGRYSFIVKTGNFEVESSLIVEDEKYRLEIPQNPWFSSNTKEVFPLPKNLLLGSVVYQGSDNTQRAMDYFEALDSIGLEETTIPNYNYRHFFIVDSTGQPVDKHWEPDKHSLPFLYDMTLSFTAVVEVSKAYFQDSDLNIYLSSSNGDQARFSQHDGILVVYAK